jgi:hypothetical protein
MRYQVPVNVDKLRRWSGGFDLERQLTLLRAELGLDPPLSQPRPPQTNQHKNIAA